MERYEFKEIEKESMTLEDCVVLLADLKCQFAEFREQALKHINEMGTELTELREANIYRDQKAIEIDKRMSRMDTDFKAAMYKPVDLTC